MIANVAPAPPIDGVEHVYSGKVRDIYRYPDGRLLFVASDRLSAYDWVLPSLIPDKGRVLTALTAWWFEQLGDVVPNHLLSLDVPPSVAGRAMIVRPLDMFAVECVARGYLSGSAWTDYQQTQSTCGVALPPGLLESERLPSPIFTPATKAAVGEHDENVSFDAVVTSVGLADAKMLRELTMAVYDKGQQIARDRGLILADTKFEFGKDATGEIVLADEVLTPDSSRLWSAEQWRPGGPQPSFDKQYVRDWLTSAESGWDRHGTQPPPELPPEVIAATRTRYVEAYEQLTAQPFDS